MSVKWDYFEKIVGYNSCYNYYSCYKELESRKINFFNENLYIFNQMVHLFVLSFIHFQNVNKRTQNYKNTV